MIEASDSAPSLARFVAPADSLASIDAETAAALIVTSSDVALVVDGEGIVRDVAFGNASLGKEAYRAWIGRGWADTVTSESRVKIEELIRDAAARTASRWRQVNYPAEQGPDIPVSYSVIRYGEDRRLVAVGRDLRAMSALQQRLAEAQQAMEREYARIRGAEKRYRLLFQLASEAVLIVDASTQRVVEANPAAGALIGKDVKKLVGQGFADLFDDSSRQATQSFVAALRVAPRVDNVHAQLPGAKEAVLLSGSLFRQESAAHLLVLLTRMRVGGAPISGENANLLRIVENLPDAFVVTDPDRRILTANSAFVDLVQATSPEQTRGESIDRWIGRPGVDLDVLFANLHTHGVVRHFSTIVRGEYGSTEDVEIAAVAVPAGDPPCFGFTIRSAGWRGSRDKLGGRELPRTVEQFADLVGRVPLKNLVRETTDLIERLCIEAALELTRDNRASAADMLGLSRQGLYAKLRRYGLGDLDGGESAN
ncbi:MAG: transcriptional regulator PpsR [Roseiarcus sp.]